MAQPILQSIQGMNGTRRFLIFAAIAAVIVGLWWLSRWASEPTFVTLFRDLEIRDAGAIEDQLGKSGIQHRLEAGGTEIQVPVSDLAKARVALAREGLQGFGRPGLELFDKPSWGMTDFTQRVTYQRALEGELERTIGRLRGIGRAQVHLVLPTPSPLRKLERPASASVVLSLQQGNPLDPETIKGITYIVSNSVEHLASSNVAILDEEGRLLSAPAGDGSVAGAASWQREHQRGVEEDLTRKITGLLAPIVGAGRMQAEVSVEMSFDQIDSTVETFDPETQVLSAEQRSESEPGTAESAAGASVMINNTYQTSRRLERSVQSVGRVTRLTAAVLVDEESLAGAEDGSGAVRVADLDGMIRDAIGYDERRGDRLSVRAVAFGAAPLPVDGTETEGEEPGFNILQTVERFGRLAIGLVGIIALLIIGLKVLRMRIPSHGSGLPPALEGKTAGSTPALPGLGQQISTQADGSSGAASPPDATAQVVRSWLAES